MTDPKGIADLVTKSLSKSAPDAEPSGAVSDTEVDSGEDLGVSAASEEVMDAFKAGDTVAFGEALTSLIEMVVAKERGH